MEYFLIQSILPLSLIETAYAMLRGEEGVAILSPPPSSSSFSLQNRISRFFPPAQHIPIIATQVSHSLPPPPSLPTTIHPRAIRSTRGRGRMEFQPHSILISRTSRCTTRRNSLMCGRAESVTAAINFQNWRGEIDTYAYAYAYTCFTWRTTYPQSTCIHPGLTKRIPSERATPKPFNLRSGAKTK